VQSGVSARIGWATAGEEAAPLRHAGTDFGAFASCFNGTGNAAPAGCANADLNADAYVDGTDFGLFASCFNGASNPAARH
jgi:hypothetical protein